MGVPVFGFEKMEVYRAAREFRRRISKLAKLLPEEEKWRLRTQMQRAALSVTNCLAEGNGRYTFRDRMHFCHESRGSLQELVDDINACADEGYARQDHLDDLKSDAFHLLKLLDGYIRFLRSEHATRSQKKVGKGRESRSIVSKVDAV